LVRHDAKYVTELVASRDPSYPPGGLPGSPATTRTSKGAPTLRPATTAVARASATSSTGTRATASAPADLFMDGVVAAIVALA